MFCLKVISATPHVVFKDPRAFLFRGSLVLWSLQIVWVAWFSSNIACEIVWSPAFTWSRNQEPIVVQTHFKATCKWTMQMGLIVAKMLFNQSPKTKPNKTNYRFHRNRHNGCFFARHSTDGHHLMMLLHAFVDIADTLGNLVRVALLNLLSMTTKIRRHLDRIFQRPAC